MSAPESATVSGARQPGLIQGMIVVIAGFLPIIAIVSMFPAVPAIIAHFHDDPAAMVKVPAMVSAPGLTIALLALFAGWLVDRYGRRKLLLVSTLTYGFFGAAPFFLDDLNAIYASRLLLGVSEAAILTTLNTLIGDYWDEAGRHRWLSIQGIAGPFLGSAVIFASGYLTAMRWNAIFLIYTVGFPIFIAMWLFLFEPQSDANARRMLGIGEDARTAFPWRNVLGYAAITLFGASLYYVFIINGGIVWQELGVKDSGEIGRLSTLPSLFVIVGAVIFWLTGKLGSRFQLALFLGLIATGLTLIGIAHDWRWMVAAMAVQQTGAGMAVPTLIALAQSKLPFEHRGRGMGVWTACFFFGQFSSPLLVSLIRQATGTMQGAFFVAGLLGLVVAALAFFLFAPRRTDAAALQAGA
ncbi:MFS transporter [Novosphingobium olei]|uniref:MFS transporter n=1 Tax=Novosphingobium olei TaxID=2728851 RepID=A0A7Y0BM41_9SPHN|nr:MFS transporter [Novosphingobium olei]NML92326.1 MFS transporter [Novosphingobium olei]